jgi:hypothetical protein
MQEAVQSSQAMLVLVMLEVVSVEVLRLQHRNGLALLETKPSGG